MSDTAPSPTSQPAPYEGDIRVAWINEWSWMRAGDKGTIRNTIDALGPVTRSIEMKCCGTGVISMGDVHLAFDDESSRYSIDAAIRTEWRSAAANMVRLLTETDPKAAPVLFISTGLKSLKPAYHVLREALGAPSLWLDILADMASPCGESSHPAAPFINAVLPDNKEEIPDTHLRLEIPYLPERRNLPSRDEARARLETHYGANFNRPLMAVLMGSSAGENGCKEVTVAAGSLAADMAVTTSPRTRFRKDEREKWRESAHIFHEFDRSGGYNPYADMIAAADYITADGDSYSLPSDVLALGKPVALFGPHDICHLIKRGFATKLIGADTVWHPPPPHERPGDIINRAVRTELAKLIR